MNTNNLFSNLNKAMMDQLFCRIENVVWDLTTGDVGILTKDDMIATFTVPALQEATENSEGESGVEEYGQVTHNPFSAMSMALPAYGQKISASEVKVGDIIVTNKQATGWVTEILPNGKFNIQKVDGNTTKFNPPNVQIMGSGTQNGVMVVRTLMNTTGGNLSGFKDSLMPLMMMSGGNLGESQFDQIIPMMLMSGNSGNNNMMQMMMMSMMFNKKGVLPF